MYGVEFIAKLNEDIKEFSVVNPVEEGMKKSLEGLQRLIMLDRYSYKDIEKKTLKVGDLVVLTVKEDKKYPVRGIGYVEEYLGGEYIKVRLEEEYLAVVDGLEVIERSIDLVEKPLELFYEQIAKRVARGLISVEETLTDEELKDLEERSYKVLKDWELVPAGRVLYGAGTEELVTLMNCYVLPYMNDSRGGISDHRKVAMEIMSRGGGVGTNGSTLRPKGTLAKGVNGKSSGSVSWLNDLADLTNLVEQGGSRRGAQLILLDISHSDVIEFIISKIQNPNVLRYIDKNIENRYIREEVAKKLKFEPLSFEEEELCKKIVANDSIFSVDEVSKAKILLEDGGRYDVEDKEFLTGANISVAITDDFMQAVEDDEYFELKFPDVENYTEEEKAGYDKYWEEVGDVREWERMGYGIKVYRRIKARDLWDLINICATYSAEPGVIFIDTAHKMSNSNSYGQKVVGTNPCGEQLLTPWAVCNLAAINLDEMVDREKKEVNFRKLRDVVSIAVRLQDNVTDLTPYFLEENERQAKGERRIGLGVMGLASMLIRCEKVYGSKEGNDLIDEVFKEIAVTAYATSIELAKEKGSFKFLVGSNDKETQVLRRKFINSGFMQGMPEYIRQGILEHGIRNSHILTTAPTGSTGSMVNVSTGLEPYFAFKYYRSGRLGKFIEVNAPIVEEYMRDNGLEEGDSLPEWFISAMELTPEAHVDVQCTVQRWVDSSISKTVNAPKGYSVEQVKKIYERLYRGGAKGGTVYVDGSRDSQVLTLDKEENDLDKVKVESGGKIYGVEIGNTCPECREGIVEELGGCNTCTNCGIQLTCGL